MKRFCPRYKMIINHAVRIVGNQRAVFSGDLFLQLFKASLHHCGSGVRVMVVNRNLEQAPAQKASFHGACLGVWQKTTAWLDFQNLQARLVPRQADYHVESVLSGPSNQFFRRISPPQAKRGIQHRLAKSLVYARKEQGQGDDGRVKAKAHVKPCEFFRVIRKPRSLCRGMLLLEATIALSVLSLIGLLMFKMAINVLSSRSWMLNQTLSDAYMTFESSTAERVSFGELTGADSDWPAYPTTSVVDGVEIGRMPGGRPLTGTITRTRMQDAAEFPAGDVALNPANMVVWQVQSVLTYTIGSRSYVKSRTVLRSQ